MSSLDAIIVVIAFATGIRGLFRGFIREAFAVIAWVGGLVLALLYSAELAPVVADRVGVGPPVDRAIAGLGIFLVAYVGLQLVGWILHRIAHAIFLGPLDRVAGLLLGALKGLVFCGLALWLASARFGQSVNQRVEASPLAATLLEAAREVVDELAPPPAEASK
jgi:membrane protein required for colicin V production